MHPSRISTRSLAGAACALALVSAVSACSHQDARAADRVRGVPVDTLTAVPADRGAWASLLKPVAIVVDQEGRVHVGDDGDKTVKIFDASGRRHLETRGRQGSGPGEVRAVHGLVHLAGEPMVLDNLRGRIVRVGSSDGAHGDVPIEGAKEQIGSLGDGRLVLASSAQWSLPGQGAQPLFEVLDADGELLFAGDGRAEAGTPFAAHVMNFVLPAGTADGGTVWLAYMNDTRVLRYDVEARTYRPVVDRALPFDWRRIPEDFRPSPEMMEQGKNVEVPFDLVSHAIDTDGAGNAYVLTMLAPSTTAGELPTEVAVDVVEAGTGEVHRLVVDGPANDLAVSPDGRRLYVLDASTARIRVYERS